jgi:hypothetical protein
MERIQILLEPSDRRALKQLAADSHTSMSAVVRDLLRERVKEQRRARLRKAADMMAGEYSHDPELIALSEVLEIE